MANNYNGKYHSLGIVRGSLFYGITSFIGSIILFYVTYIAEGSKKTFLFIGLALLSFSIANISLFIYSLYFGMGSGNIRHSYNRSKDDNPTLYISTKLISLINFILTIIFFICVFTVK